MNRYKSNLYQSHLSGLYVVISFLSGSFACLPLFWVSWCCDYFNHSLRVGNSFIPLKSYPFPRSFTKRSHYSQISITRASVIQIFQLSGRSFLVSSFLNIYIHLFDHSDSWLSGVSSPVFTSPDNQGSTVYAIWDNIFDFSLKMILYLRCY